MLWTTFLLSVVLSFVRPLWVITFIILFDLYWLLRVCYFIIYMVQAWRSYRLATVRDWYADLERDLPAWRDLYHLIFLPTYQEDFAVLDQTLRHLSQIRYDPKRFIVVLAGEERDRERFERSAELLRDTYEGKFFKFIVTLHPQNLPDEIPGKGSNLNWAGHRTREIVDALGLTYANIVVSSFDIDTIVHPQYFACLAYTYLTHPKRLRSSYQPAVLYSNNIWQAPAITRIAAFGTTFWLMTELARPERLSTFSSHSMSWQALVDVGFWEKRIVTEDSRIFLQCLIHYDGDYTVTPIYVPVSMDTVMAPTYWKSLVALYKQQRRWAWGIEHFPYMLWNFAKHPRMPLRTKFYYLWNITEGMYSWAAAPILIFVLGHLPLYAAPQALREQALVQNAPHVLETLLQLSMVGILVSVILSLRLLPPRPESVKRRTYLTMLLQWGLLPVTLVLFGSLPAIDAQTRLMLGSYLGFNVTKKVRPQYA